MLDLITGMLSGFAVGLLFFVIVTIFRTNDSVARLERKLDLLLKQSGVDLSALAIREAEAPLKAGRKIEAIKVYRQLTGTGLAEAKDAVERLQ